MPKLIRTAKSGSDWTQNELDAYRVVFKFVNAQEFCGVAELPQPTINSKLLTIEKAEDMQDMHNCALTNLLDLAMAPNAAENRVDDFAASLCLNIGYVTRTHIAQTKTDLLLIMCSCMVNAQTDVCIIDQANNRILLLVQEDKHASVAYDARPQLIAEALAAFQYNNLQRTLVGLPKLTEKVSDHCYIFFFFLANAENQELPRIMMFGTSPTFFRIPITDDLARAVCSGICPESETVVLVHMPEVPRPHRRLSEGMRPLDNRRVFLQCYEAFKCFIN
jgi:hypothetical protein